MSLDDGRMLVSHRTYSSLLRIHSQAELDDLKIVPVHPDFRVIALALPVPRYPGNPMDPPLRSRFQGRYVPSFSVATFLSVIPSMTPHVEHDLAKTAVSLSHALRLSETGSLFGDCLVHAWVSIFIVMLSLDSYKEFSKPLPEFSDSALLAYVQVGPLVCYVSFSVAYPDEQCCSCWRSFQTHATSKPSTAASLINCC